MKGAVGRIGSPPASFYVYCYYLLRSGAVGEDTINGVVADSLFGSAIDSVAVSSGAALATTNASGAFTLVFSPTHTLFSAVTPEQHAVNLNPATGLISWAASTGNVSIRVMDVRGRVAARCISGAPQGGYSLASLPEGFYLVGITLRKETSTYKFLRMQGNSCGSFRTISDGSGAVQARLGLVAVTQKPHVLVCAKTGYKTDTVTIGAGTSTGTVAAIKMIGAEIPQKAIETVEIQANGSPVSFKTSLDSGQVYLLKACGALQFNAYALDAEFGTFDRGRLRQRQRRQHGHRHQHRSPVSKGLDRHYGRQDALVRALQLRSYLLHDCERFRQAVDALYYQGRCLLHDRRSDNLFTRSIITIPANIRGATRQPSGASYQNDRLFAYYSRKGDDIPALLRRSREGGRRWARRGGRGILRLYGHGFRRRGHRRCVHRLWDRSR